MSGRCTLVDAINLLVPPLKLMEAAAKLTQAVNSNDCRLYCNKDEPVKAHIAAVAKVVLDVEKDGRWTADIVSTGPGLGWAKGAYTWEFDVDEVKALKPQADAAAAKTTVAVQSGTRTKRRSRTQDAIRSFAAERWPDGFEHVEDRDLVKIVGDALGLPISKRDTILRALGRRTD
jgi:hypothetical protein